MDVGKKKSKTGAVKGDRTSSFSFLNCEHASFPVAIVGTAFRFPGDLNDEKSFWNALKDKKDLITEIPGDRWATNELQHDNTTEAGRSVTFSAGVLSRIDAFDAGFFGISPREAAWMDPQQRLLLELSWEAIENAGILPSALAGTDCAVYVGISCLDYGTRGLDDLASLSSHYMTGNTLSMAANRLSYVLDLHGPSLAVDTACSSSLVALHHACNSLRLGDASTAVVGGVHLLAHPYPFVGFSKATMLSPDGRSKAFDASANGYVRSEGGAVVLLKPLERALADGDEIHSVILSSGINTDGSRKTGITIPSCEGQAELMRRVLSQSGLAPGDIDYIEAHGTGTPVGDPIEAAAISEVYGQERAQALPIGSVKANLGHMEPASGITGLVKAMLVLKNGALPPALHLNEVNPKIDLKALNLEINKEYRELAQSNGKPMVAGVNSFGFGGANAHVLLQAPPVKMGGKIESPAGMLPPLTLSARTDEALQTLAGHYADLLSEGPDNDYYDVAYAALFNRERLEKRLALLPASSTEAVSLLSQYALGEAAAGIAVETGLPEPGSVAFVYSGNGAQWVGMGRKLLHQSQRFGEIVAWLDSSISPLTDYSVLEELQVDPPRARLEDTVVAQPLLFTIQVACTLLLKELGVEPAAVTGHSVGEVTAAWAAGALDLDQAIRVIVARSTAQGKTRGAGKMAAAGLSEEAFASLLADLGGQLDVAIAGVNSPKHITLSGSLDSLDIIGAHLRDKGIFFRLLDLDYAFHSRQMDPIADCLIDSLSDLVPAQTDTSTVFVSAVTGKPLDGSSLDVNYWWRNVREPVLFSRAIAAMAALGCRVFIEIGPHAILKHYISESLAAVGVQGRVMSCLRKEADGYDRIVETALRSHLLSEESSLKTFFPGKGRRIRLPNYPWQREHHWHPRTGEGLNAIERRRVHPVLGYRLHDAEMAWENTIDPTILPWLADHRVGGSVVFPGSAYMEMALAAAREWLGRERLVIEETDIVSPMVFAGEHARTVHFILNPRDGGFQIQSRQRLSSDQWMVHATGRIREPGGRQPQSTFAPLPGSTRKIEREAHYRMTARLGLDYGPSFQGLYEAKVLDNRLDAILKAPAIIESGDSYCIHPALLDVCCQSLVDFFQDEIEAGIGKAYLPVKVGLLDVYHDSEITGFRTCVRRRGSRSVLADFELLDVNGGLVANLSGCRFRVAPLAHRGLQKTSQWAITPKLAPHPLESLVIELPPSKALAERGRETIALLDAERHRWFKETLPLSEALAVSFIYEAFQRFQKDSEDGLQPLVDSSSPYLRWLVGLLSQEGFLREEGGRCSLVADRDLPGANDIWHTLLSENPSCLPQLTLLGRVGKHLPALLQDEKQRFEFARGLKKSLAAEPLYDDDPAYKGVRLALEGILLHLGESVSSHRRLRVLEITAGPSTLPRQILEILPEDHLDYVLAHVDEKYCQRQEAEFQSFHNMTLACLDLENWTLEAEKPLPDHFDVVIVRHTMHRAESPHTGLSQVRALLSSGGVLLLAERYPDWSADLVAGLDPGWWRGIEGDEPDAAGLVSSLTDPGAWRHALEQNGFSDVDILTEPAAGELAEGAYVLIAKRPAGDETGLPVPETRSWVLLVDDSSVSFAKELAERLEKQGQQVTVAAGCEAGVSGANHVISLIGWEAEPGDDTALFGALLEQVQALGTIDEAPPRLWFVTRGGALADGKPESVESNPVQAGIWGFGRVVMNEYPALDCTLIDLANADDVAQTLPHLENEFLFPAGENEIVLSGNCRKTLVMEEVERTAPAAVAGQKRFRLDFHVPGKLRNLTWVEEEERGLGDEEIEVCTHATGLNFRDIMYVMGLLPDEAVENGFAGASLGLEFSGRITRIGSGVTGYQPGDAVMGFGASCFASHVITSAHTVMRMPNDWSFEAAATVPTVYFTAYYALHYLADVQPGERVLIHGGAGGVGIAAIRLARHLGAEIFATAGSDEKRDFVRLLGADHVFDSRSLSFADEILEITGGEGVDIILNSLAGEAIRRNMRLLKPFGRFLELGKRDFYENTPLGLRYFKDNISYFGIDVDQLFLSRPQVSARLFQEISKLFEEDVLAPLPYRVFRGDRVVDAYYEMMEARHIGKVVVTLKDIRPQIEQATPAEEVVSLEKDSTWLVTGGLEGFGLESARWLVSRGVGNLVLMGRRGESTPGAGAAIAELRRQDVNVLLIACDVTDKEQLAKELARVELDMPPVKGIIHAAMVIDDRLLANLDAQSFKKVVQPKLKGAWNLHQLTRNFPLDYFVLYSSITTAIGNPGQGNYVTANGGLEGLAQMRRSQGLPATCIGWGPIGDAGYLTRSTDVRDSLEQRLGKPPLGVTEALELLDRILLSGDAVVAVADFDWNVLSRLLPSALCDRFSILNRNVNRSGLVEESADFKTLVADKTPKEIRRIVRQLVVQNVAQVLLIKAERIEVNSSLHDLGLDSLMAVELAQGLEQSFGLQLPVMMLNESPSVESVTSFIVEKLVNNQGDAEKSDTAKELVQDLARQHGENIEAADLERLVEETEGAEVMNRSVVI